MSIHNVSKQSPNLLKYARRKRTGGCSSFSESVRSGRADILANTPSDASPEPITRPDLDDVTSVLAVWYVPLPLFVDASPVLEGVTWLWLGAVFCRTSRCLSSASSSLASSSSNASASVESTGSFRRWGDDEREWKDGGGDPGMGWWPTWRVLGDWISYSS